THQLEDVDEPLPRLVVGLHPIEEFGERRIMVVVRGERHPRRGGDDPRPIRLRDPRQQRERLFVRSALDQQLGERHDHVFTRRIEFQRGTERHLVTDLQQPADLGLGLGGEQSLDELADLVLTLCTHERVDGLTVDHRHDHRDRLHAEGLGDRWILVDVDLHQDDLSVGLVDDLVEDRSERAARATPRGPEVDDDRGGERALHHLGLERCIRDIDRHACTISATRRPLGPTAGTLDTVHDGSLRWLGPIPELDAPVLVVTLDGWIDAAGAASGAFGAVCDEATASPIAEFDDDVYLDFRARRPTMELRDGLDSVLEWQRITLSVGHDGTGRDLLLLGGPEPDMAWHRFCRIVGELAELFGVRTMVHFGAYPFAVPHTRPTLVSVTSPSQDVLARVPFLRSSIDVPAGVAAALEHELHGRGVESLGIWAQVPHYVASMTFPAASVALLDGLRTATGVVIDAAELRAEMIERGRRLDGLIAGNDEHTRMITQLEMLYDDADRPSVGPGSSDPPPTELPTELPSGDELAAELEAYLREQD
ncbi:MAG: hypothetical protein RLZZ01_1897, partial [Actinomycetota bacterium]